MSNGKICIEVIEKGIFVLLQFLRMDGIYYLCLKRHKTVIPFKINRKQIKSHELRVYEAEYHQRYGNQT